MKTCLEIWWKHGSIKESQNCFFLPSLSMALTSIQFMTFKGTHCLLEQLCFSFCSMNPSHFLTSVPLHVLFLPFKIPFSSHLLHQNLPDYSSFIKNQLNIHFSESFLEGPKRDGDLYSVFANLCFIIPTCLQWMHRFVLPVSVHSLMQGPGFIHLCTIDAQQILLNE